MNNTRTLAIVAILTAATLVVGVTFAAATPSALGAYGQKKGGNDKKDKERDNGSASGNTDTAQIEENKKRQ